MLPTAREIVAVGGGGNAHLNIEGELLERIARIHIGDAVEHGLVSRLGGCLQGGQDLR